MKTIFLAGSRKFSDELENASSVLMRAGFNVVKGRDTVQPLGDEEEKQAHVEMLNRIDKSDVVYIISDGYIGRTVAMEAGYAIARKKVLFSSNAIKEAGLNHFVSSILNPEELVKMLKEE